MRFLFLISFLFLENYLYAQKCNCAQELKFLEYSVEQDLPSYHDQVIRQKRHAAYLKHKEECDKIATALTDSTDCIFLVAKYISFFRDEHLALNFKDGYFPFSSLDDTTAVRSFFGREKNYPIPHIGNIKPSGIEGLWRSKDKAYIVQIVKHKTPLSDYAGLIIKADPVYWTRGQIKFLLKQIGKDQYEAIYRVASRQPRVRKAALEGPGLVIGRTNTYYRITDTTAQDNGQNNFFFNNKLEFRQLSDKTNYLSIPDFDFSRHNAIDSIVKANLTSIISKPNLIIDVRNNGGGATQSCQALLPLILDSRHTPDPIGESIFASPEIIRFFEDTKYKNCETREDSLDDDTTLAIMQRNKGKFTPTKFDTLIVDTIYSYPKKVAILANRFCASTTEGLIVDALQSKKVTLYGENTMGALTYGAWRVVNMPCLPIMLSMPTKKMFFMNTADYESIGITPRVKLDPMHEETWINDVVNRLEK